MRLKIGVPKGHSDAPHPAGEPNLPAVLLTL